MNLKTSGESSRSARYCVANLGGESIAAMATSSARIGRYRIISTHRTMDAALDAVRVLIRKQQKARAFHHADPQS